MFWWGPGWGWIGGLISFGFWILILAVAVTLLRREMPHIRSPHHRSPAVETLEERYARGEITREEFLERRAVLQAHHSQVAPAAPSSRPAAYVPPPEAPAAYVPPPEPPPPPAVERAEEAAGQPTQQLPSPPTEPPADPTG